MRPPTEEEKKEAIRKFNEKMKKYKKELKEYEEKCINGDWPICKPSPPEPPIYNNPAIYW